MNVEIGKPIPEFELPNENGDLISSNSLRGKKFILFFYPKDDSPGCTKEACSVRDNFKALSAAGYEIFGVSPDKPAKHLKFIDKYEFQYSLLADTEKKMINDFGLWGPKKFMGRTFDGVHRTTFVIDEKGKIEKVIEKVKAKIHSEQIME